MDETKPVVLVVDDSPFYLKIVTGVLRESYTTLAATDGEKALDLVAKNSDVALILLDIKMPGMDGFEVCRKLKQNPRTATIPVIFLTGADNAEEYAQAFAVGCVDLLIKPTPAAMLLARVSAQLRRRALERELRQPRGPKP